ncbi:MAG: hypothetical protein LBQ01_00325 [Prevotellaceae bacterium]|jgi:hypothetical protein|nr:hypothetical protein [Prevotellaceae bacterium]
MKEYKYQEQEDQQGDNESECEVEEDGNKTWILMWNEEDNDEEEDKLFYGGNIDNETGMLIGAVIFAIIVGVPAITLLVYALLL